MTQYMIVIEKGEQNYGAFVPDVDGVIATGDTIEEVTQNMQEALAFHLESLCKDGDPIPQPTCHPGYVEVDIPQRSLKAGN